MTKVCLKIDQRYLNECDVIYAYLYYHTESQINMCWVVTERNIFVISASEYLEQYIKRQQRLSFINLYNNCI